MRCTRRVARTASTLLVLGLITLAAACGSEDYSTSGFRLPTHLTTVSGRALAQDGTPLDSVRIGVAVSYGAGYDYAVINARTDSEGNFSYPVQRMTAPRQVPSPDTVRAVVQAILEKKRFATSAGAAPELSETVLLTFVPFGQTPSVSRVEFRFAVP